MGAYFTNSEISLLQRILVMVSLWVMVFIVNDTFKFTYYYRMQRKVEYLGQLTDRIVDSNTDSLGKKAAAALREELLAEEPAILQIHLLLRNHLNGAGGSSTSTNPRLTPNATTGNIMARSMTVSILFYIKLLMSTIGMFLIVGLIIISRIVTNQNGSVYRNLLISTALFAMLVVSAFAVHLLFLWLIPSELTLRARLILNVILQFLIVLYAFILMTIRKRKSK